MRNVDESLSLKDRITVKVIAGKEDDEETAAETQKFSFEIESVTPLDLTISIKFDFP